MAEIVKRGEFSNRPYKFIISGDEPNVDEQMRIDQVLREREFSFAKDYEAKYGQQLTDEGSGVLNYLGEIPKGIARGGVGIFESALLGGAALLPEGAETSAREGIRGLAYALKPQADVGLEDSVAAKGSEALGSFAALGLTSLIPYAGPVAAGALAIGAGAGEASERARAAGATAEQRGISALMGAPLGALDLLPIKFLGALGETAATTIVNRLARAAAEGGVEGAQEAATTIAQNLIEQGVYNPEKGTFSDTGEALGYGAGVGALVQGLLDLLPGRSVGSADTTTIDPAATPAVTPPAVTPPTSTSSRPIDEIAAAGVIPDATAPAATVGAPATVFAVKRVTTGRTTTTKVGLNDGTDLTLNGDASQADIDRAVFEYNQTKAAAAPAAAPIITPAPTVTPGEAPIITPAPTVTPTAPAPEYKINKIVQKATKSKTGQKYKTTATVEGIGPVEVYSNEKFLDKNDPALKAKVANAISPTQTNEVGMDDVPRPPLAAYPEGNVSPKTVEVGKVGMGEVPFAPIGLDPAAAQADLFVAPIAPPTPASTAAPSGVETEAEALERAAEERKIAEAAAEADRLAAIAEADRIAKEAATPAQGDFLGELDTTQEAAPQDTQTAVGDGWKLHLNPVSGSEQAISDYLKEKNIPHKVGRASGQEGKGMTVYVGSRDDANALAADINSRFSDALNDAEGDVLTDDTQISGKVWGRFDTPLNKTFHQYGAAGVPFLNDDMSQLNFAEDRGAAIESAKQRADSILQRQYGAYYTGSANVREGTEAQLAEAGAGFSGGTPGVGEGTGAGSEGQTAEVTTASGTGGLAGGMPPSDNAGAAGGTESGALREQHLRQYYHPGGDWLKGKQAVAAKNPDRKFMVGPVTADIGTKTDVFLPTDVLSGLAGLENEVRRTGDSRYDALLADAQANGFDPDQKKNKIVVAVNHYGQAYILEGNTRVAVAKALGVAKVKAEVRYWNGGEDVDGPMSPDKVLAMLTPENNAAQRQADATAQTANDVGMPMAAVASAAALDKPLSANTRAFLEAGDLKGALLSLSKDTKNPILKALAKAFARLVGTTRVKVLYPGDPAKNIGSNRGVFWQASAKGDPERQNIIYLNGQTGMTAHVLMHEMAHAVTANVINNPNLPITRQLQDLLNAVRKQVATPGAFGYSYELQGLTNLSEFVADAYGRVAFGAQDNGLRDLMNNTLFTNIKYETNELPLTNFERFKEIIGNFFRGLVGLPSKPYPRRKITNEVRTTETGLDRFHQIMDNLLSPAPQVLPSKIFNAAVANPLIGRNVLNNAGRVPTWSPSAASRMYDVIRESIPDWLRNFALSLQQIDWIADFSRKALPVIDEIKSIFDRRQGESARLQKIVSQLPERYSVLAKANPAGFKRYIGILDTATRNQVDITKPRNTYKDDAGKLFIWDKLSKEMKAIDPDGKFREAYNIHIALNDSIRQEWFNAVTLQVNQTTEDPAERTALRDKLMAQLLESGIIDPYFPLMREGKYWVSYVQTETTSRPPTAPGVGTKEALFAPEAVVSTFESIGAARAFIAELNNAKLPDGRPAAVEITQEPFIMDFAKGYDKSVPLEFVQGAIKILDEIVPEASQREAGRAAIIEMFTRMSPAYSAMAQFRSRKDGGRAGAMGYESPVGNVTEPGEYIAALQNRLAGTVNAIVNSKFVPELEAAKSRLRAQAENAQKDRTNTLADKIAINATAKELEKRISFARNPTSSRVAYHGRGLTFLWTLGALPAATINVFFQMPMVVVPQLMGRHGSIGAITRAFNTARLISQSSGISQLVQEPGQANPTQVKELENWGSLENYYSVDDAGNFNLRTDRKIPDALRTKLEELAPLAQYMSKNGMLSTTIAQSELSGMGDVASRIYRFSGLPLQYAERFTRQSTSIAAFLLEQDKIRGAKGQKDYKLTPEEVSAAVKYAVDTTELTNGTVGILTGPSAATSGVGSILLMYKRYALSMLRFITNGVRRSLTKITPDMTPEQVADAKMERKIARYQLASMIGSTAIFAGIQGLPFFGEATTILDMMFTDDDEEDFKTLAQKSLQEPLYSGLVNYLTGAEVASRISMSGLVFRESPIQKDQSLLYDAFEMFGGPVLGTYLNVERGIGLVNDGEVYRGIEAMVPSSVRAFMRAYRYAEAGGAETMRGDQITPLDGWDVAVQLLGYTPEAVIRTQEAVGREKRITEAVRSEKNQLYKRFNLALVDGDYEEVRQVQQEMAEFMREHPELGGFDLKASVRGFRQRSQDMVGGVYIPKPFQPGVRESLDEYGRELPQ